MPAYHTSCGRCETPLLVAVDENGCRVYANTRNMERNFLLSEEGVVKYKSTDDYAICPVCGSDLQEYKPEEDARKQHELAVNCTRELKEKCKYPHKEISKEDIDVKQYIKLLVGIETDIVFFTDRLESLYLLKGKTERKITRIRCLDSLNKRKTLDEAKEEMEALPSKYELKTLDIQPYDFGFYAPFEPLLRKPGLFNKKKVEEENAILTEKYESQLAEYERNWAEKKEQEIAIRTAENKELQAKYETEEERLKGIISVLENEIKSSSDMKSVTSDPKVEFIDSEITETTNKIAELCDVRGQLICLGIIYPKYLDFVALTTIEEYLEVGRCTTLDGPDGAYNLYESEIRANTIIAQLDQVVDSLETIKQNQFKTYELLSEVNSNIQTMSDKLSEAVKSLNSIKETNEVIAYNTYKAAYYSKVNADLTNAMGYLVAFK